MPERNQTTEDRYEYDGLAYVRPMGRGIVFVSDAGSLDYDLEEQLCEWLRQITNTSDGYVHLSITATAAEDPDDG